MFDEKFLGAHASAFENFWNRPYDDSFFEFEADGFGYTIHFRTNEALILDAVRMSAARYCRAEPFGDKRIELEVSVAPSLADAPVPDELPAALQTIGVGDYLFQAATPWLQWFTDLKARRSVAVVSRALAAQPRVPSRYLLDRAVTNILVREGVGQIHATTLAREKDVLLFIAPHGTGKSTTAFHLLNAGYRLMGDGLLFIRARDENFELMGYPVGEAKLTREAQPLFPEWRGEGDEVSVHNVVKHIVNLRALAPHKMIDHSIFPKRIVLCLAERNGQAQTTAELLDAETAFASVLPDSIHWDKSDAMQRSLNVLRRLIGRASCYRLALGTDREQLIETILALQ